MSIESIGDLVRRARAEAASKTEANPGSERDRLIRVAQEFESMLMLQMLKEMRKAGSWEDEEQSEGGLGAQTMFETIDMELAGHLAQAQGLGLGKQLMDAFQRMQPEREKEVGRVLESGTGEAIPTGGSPKQDPPYEMPRHEITSGFGWRTPIRFMAQRSFIAGSISAPPTARTFHQQVQDVSSPLALKAAMDKPLWSSMRAASGRGTLICQRRWWLPETTSGRGRPSAGQGIAVGLPAPIYILR